MPGERVVVIGGGLAGLTAAIELLERGICVTIIEKTRNLGGNSSKATCGIAAPGSLVQQAAGVQDSGADLAADGPAAKVLVEGGAKDVEWLTKTLGVGSELALRTTPGHGKTARTLGTKDHFPGAVVTYAAIHVLQQVAAARPELLELVTSAAVTKLATSAGKVVGVEYSKDGNTTTAEGIVVVATGGYAGDTGPGSLLSANCPSLLSLPTTNDERCSGDGVKLALAAGAGAEKLDQVLVAPTAGVLPGQEDSSFKVVISEAICGAGAKMLDAKGARFCDELAPAAERVAAMGKVKAPVRLVIGEADAQAVQWLVEFYTSKKLMSKMTASQLAGQLQTSTGELQKTLGADSTLYVATITPALYSCGGGIKTGWEQGKAGMVLNSSGTPIPGLYAAGEVSATPYQKIWSVSGVPLLHCIHSGRAAGRAAAAAALNGAEAPVQEMRDLLLSSMTVAAAKEAAGSSNADTKKPEDMTKEELLDMVKKLQAGGAVAAAAAPVDNGPPSFTLEDVAKHKKKDDAWLVLFGEVLDVTKWIPIHPGGEQAICAYLGMDATDEWKLIHKPGTVEKYLQHITKMGKIGGGGGGGAAPVAAAGDGGLSPDDVAKHSTKEDAWIILHGEALDVTKWIPIHPGGEAAIMAYLGKDATDEWVMIHKPGTVEKYLQHITKKGKVSGVAASTAVVPTGPQDDPCPEGNGGIPGVLGAVIFAVLNLLRLVIPGRIFFTNNFKFSLDNNRNGTIRSALFLITFIIIHALGNFVDMLGGPDELNGEGYLFDRIHWTGGLGFWNLCPFSIVEEYLALCFLLHIIVALKRSWDISINYCIYTGRWNMLISGLSILFFLTQHLQDFRFYEGYDMVSFRAPKYFIAFDGLMEGRVFSETDPSVEPVKVRDIYTHEVALFKDLGTVMLYQVLLTIFIMHMCMGWKKMVTADAFQIPRDHQNRVKWLGWIASVAVAGMYMVVPWYVYFTEPEKVVPAV